MEQIKQKAYNTLRWSERYTKTDMVYLARGGFWLTLGQIVAALSSFLLAVAFAHFLPKESYGTYKYILAIGGTLSLFTLPGMSTAVTQAVARGFDDVIKPALRARLKWGSLGGVVSLSVGGYYYIQGNYLLSASLLIIGLFLPLMETLGLYDALLQGKQKFATSTKYFIISHISFVTLSLLALPFTKNIIVFIFIYFFSWTAFRFIFLKKSLAGISKKNDAVGSFIKYGNHLSFMGIIGIIANYADRILLFHYVGAQEAAIYSIAIALPEQMKGMFKNISSLALPKFSQASTTSQDSFLWRKIIQLIFLLIFITILYIIIAPFLFNFFFPKYLESIIYSQIFSLSLVTTSLIIPVSYLQATESKKELYIFNILSPIVQLVLLFIGAYSYGILGVILARVVARFFNLVLSFVLLKTKKTKASL